MNRPRSRRGPIAAPPTACLVLAVLGFLSTMPRAGNDDAAVHGQPSCRPTAAPVTDCVRSIAGLSPEQTALFDEGRAEFEQRWVVPFHIGGQWGRGPLSNGEACSDCHAGNGRGRAPGHDGAPLTSMLVRVSLPGAGPHGDPVPHPAYGLQLQSLGVLGKVPAEARPRLRYVEQIFTFSDGEQVSLRKPALQLQELRYGAIEPEGLFSVRIAPPLFGVGLLEAVPDATILELAARQRAAGLNGRPNRVFDREQQRLVLGRFGHKANQPSLVQQIATALIEDLGVTSHLFPVENCTALQVVFCATVPSVGTPELSRSRFEALLFYLQTVAPPERRHRDDVQVKAGERLFVRARCSQCHVPALETGPAALPVLANRIIEPYSDLLLHDMGEELADGRPDFDAGPRDWRTPPLWGIGTGEQGDGNASYLHDGRARTLTEAIVWHGGEAQAARDAFVALSRQERDALLAFLRSL